MNRIVHAALLLAAVVSACGSGERAPAEPEADAKRATTREGYAAISADGAREAAITTERAAPGRIRDSISVYGSVQADAQRQRNIVARYPGVVTAMQVVVGDAVKAGDLLARVEASDTLESYSITAPIGDIVTARNLSPGEVAADQPLFVITDLSSVWVDLSLFPRDVPRVHLGQSVTVKSIDGSLSTTGRISWISTLGATSSQSITARVQLANPRREWTPGLYVSGEIALSETAAPVVVRTDAIQSLSGQAVLFVPVDGGFEARPVQTGRSDGQVIELLSGLKAGEAYAAGNSFIVKAEMEKNNGDDDEH